MFMVGLCIVQTLECLSSAATHRRDPSHLAPPDFRCRASGLLSCRVGLGLAGGWQGRTEVDFYTGKERLRPPPPPPSPTHPPRVGVKSVDERGLCLGWKV